MVLAASLADASGWDWIDLHLALGLPITNSTIAIEDSLQYFLLEWMFSNFIFVDGDTEPWFGIGSHGPRFWIDHETFLDDVIAPWDVVMDRLTNDIAWL